MTSVLTCCSLAPNSLQQNTSQLLLPTRHLFLADGRTDRRNKERIGLVCTWGVKGSFVPPISYGYRCASNSLLASDMKISPANSAKERGWVRINYRGPGVRTGARDPSMLHMFRLFRRHYNLSTVYTDQAQAILQMTVTVSRQGAFVLCVCVCVCVCACACACVRVCLVLLYTAIQISCNKILVGASLLGGVGGWKRPNLHSATLPAKT